MHGAGIAAFRAATAALSRVLGNGAAIRRSAGSLLATITMTKTQDKTKVYFICSDGNRSEW